MIDREVVLSAPELVKENIRKKFQDEKLPLVDELCTLCDLWKKKKHEGDELRRSRNTISRSINELKKKGDRSAIETTALNAKEIVLAIEQNEEEVDKLNEQLLIIEDKIPNMMSNDVPLGKDSTQNVQVKTFGTINKQSFDVRNHAELAEWLGMADFESSADVTGTGFYYLQGDLALLNRALINYAIDVLVKKGFLYVETPLLLRTNVINSVTDLNDQEKMIYKLLNDDLALIGTSEHSLIGRYIGKKIDEKCLPIKHTSYSMCFRREIGSHGIDEKGLFRTHQFNKVEMIVICAPEDSERFFDDLTNITIEIFTSLEIPIRTLAICSGDLGDLKYRQFDVEAYSPKRKNYFEVGSCSNLTSAQAKKLGITAIVKGEKIIPHTLNNTAIATSRALVAILENHQQKDGSVIIPNILRPYMNGKSVLLKSS